MKKGYRGRETGGVGAYLLLVRKRKKRECQLSKLTRNVDILRH
jgi:hypothetical protein